MLNTRARTKDNAAFSGLPSVVREIASLGTNILRSRGNSTLPWKRLKQHRYYSSALSGLSVRSPWIQPGSKLYLKQPTATSAVLQENTNDLGETW